MFLDSQHKSIIVANDSTSSIDDKTLEAGFVLVGATWYLTYLSSISLS